MCIAIGALLALEVGASSPAHADPEASSTMNAWQDWSLGKNPDVRVNDPIILYGTVDWCSGFFCGKDNVGTGPYTTQWKLGDGSPTQTQSVSISGGSGSVGVSRSVTYTSTGAFQPELRTCGSGGCTGWDKYDVVFVNQDLDVGPNQNPNTTSNVWTPNDNNGVCAGGGGRDGRPNTTFTFSAAVDDPENDQIAVEWDFDDNGTVDARTPASGFQPEGTKTTTHAMGVVGSWEPKARAVDDHGGTGGWDKFDCLLTDINLDTVQEAPSATMQWWSPCYEVLGLCSPGAPDGRPATSFTFTADYEDGDDDLGGLVTDVEWDFDGDGTGDLTQSFAGSGSGTRTTTHTYNAEGSFEPQVRFKDNDGLWSGWDKKDNILCVTDSECDLDVDAVEPTATMQWWSPCYEILGLCSPGAPDGRPATTFTFTADYTDPDSGSGSAVNKVEWDFDGNGTVDQTQTFTPSASGTRTTTYSYGVEGIFEPQVRFTDIDGAVSPWDKKDSAACLLDFNCDLDVDAIEPDATMQWWSPCFEILGLCSPGAPDGRPATTFTFTADYTDPDSGSGSAVNKVEWDFDGNGTVDQTQTFTPSASGTRTTTYSYGAEGIFEPQVRFTDIDGAVSPWDKKDSAACLLDFNCDLDVDALEPDATMQWWDPCFEIAGFCSPGAPDGRPATTFTFTADFDDPDAGAGSLVTQVEWDWDGDGTADSTQAVAPAGSGTVTATHSYGAEVVVQPQVRFVDNDGAVGAWDKFDIVFVPVALDAVITAPDATMQWWDPCFEILGVCSPGSPDGRPGTNFKFTADFEDDDSGLGGQVVQLQWDYNDDCAAAAAQNDPCIDDTQNVGPAASGTAASYHTYGAVIVTEPKVRAVDNDGAAGGWDKYDNPLCLLDFNCDLDAVITPPDAEGRFTPYSVLSYDGTTTTQFTFNATDSTDGDANLGGAIVQYQWDFNGDTVIDRTTATPTTQMTYDSFGWGPGTYTATVTVVDNDGATDTDQFDDNPTGLIPVDVDIVAACVGDQDGDGVPCDFDPDDTTYYRERLDYVKLDASAMALLTNFDPDAAALAPVSLTRQNILGQSMVQGNMKFVNADVFPSASFREAVFNLWLNSYVGSDTDTAYVKGIGFCLKENPASLFKYDFGFCNWQGKFDDDQGLLELEDEFKIKATFSGKTIAYEGFTFPLGGEFKVGVTDI